MNHNVIVYIYPLNDYRELDSYEELCIYANGSTITSFSRELNLTGVIYLSIYVSFFKLSSSVCSYLSARITPTTTAATE